MTITGKQVEDARKLLGWSQNKLANEAAVSPSTVESIESGQANFMNYMRRSVIAALEAAGVEFIAENGGGAGVRLRKAGAAAPSSKAGESAEKATDTLNVNIAPKDGGASQALPVDKLNASNDE